MGRIHAYTYILISAKPIPVPCSLMAEFVNGADGCLGEDSETNMFFRFLEGMEGGEWGCGGGMFENNSKTIFRGLKSLVVD